MGPSIVSLCVCVGACVSMYCLAWLCLLDLRFELCSCLTLGKCWQLMN